MARQPNRGRLQNAERRERQPKRKPNKAERDARKVERDAERLNKQNAEVLKRRAERQAEGLDAAQVARLEARDAAREQVKEQRIAARRKARDPILIPLNDTDTEHQNPNFDVPSHTVEVNRELRIMADKYGDESIVITHFVDGTAIGIVEKAKRTDFEGDEALPYVRWRKENDYVWIELRNPSSAGTVT